MKRLESIRKTVDELLRQQPDKEESRCGFVHLYGVSIVSSLISLKRGLNPELSATAGMLHDISSYKTGNSQDHGRLSSIEAHRILKELGSYTEDEINVICHAITNHSNKKDIGDIYDEVLKDSDVLQHFLYRIEIKENEKERLLNILKEFDISNF